ncbi:hypothetical protein D3C87_1685520 [compost metagenome]
MAHYNRVHVGADDGDSVRQRLAFFAERRIAAVGETDHARAEAVHRGLERQTGAGGGFKEAARNHFVLEQLGLWVGLQFCRGIENQFQLFAAEVIDGNDVFLIKRIHVYLLTPGKKKPLK